MKKYIPNILTTYRIFVALLIPFLFFKGQYNTLSILFVIALLSDLFDGYLARKWNVISIYGKMADAIGDKLLALSASTTFIIAINKNFIITLILEFIIIIINCTKFIAYGNLKNREFNKNKSSIYGKIKTVFLFISLFIGFISYKYSSFSKLILPFIIITAIFQVITAINYAIRKED